MGLKLQSKVIKSVRISYKDKPILDKKKVSEQYHAAAVKTQKALNLTQYVAFGIQPNKKEVICRTIVHFWWTTSIKRDNNIFACSLNRVRVFFVVVCLSFVFFLLSALTCLFCLVVCKVVNYKIYCNIPFIAVKRRQ